MFRPVASGMGGGGGTPVFGRSVNPIATGWVGGTLGPPHYYVPPTPSGFSDLATAHNEDMLHKAL